MSPFVDFVWLLTCKTHEEVEKPLRPQQEWKKGAVWNECDCECGWKT